MKDDLTIRREIQGADGRYVLVVDGLESELTYRLDGDRMTILHTFVPPSQRGGGLALALVARAVADARTEHLTINPICWYARAEIERHAEWRDILAT